MARVLLVDTNISSLPIYNYLEGEDFEVYVIGRNPEDFLAKYSKNFIYADYADLKILGEIIDNYNFDYIVPGCNDVSYKVCSSLSAEREFYGIDTEEVTETINNKEKFRRLSQHIGLPVPTIFDSSQQVEFPVIIKPVDSYSGQGVTVLLEPDEEALSIALKKARSVSSAGRYVIEEYYVGQLYSHSAFIKSGNIISEFYVREDCTAYPFAVDTSRVINDLEEDITRDLRCSALKLAEELGLVDGLLHTQFILGDKGIRIIEVTRRCPGDLYSLLIEFSLGYRYVESYVKPFLNRSLSDNSNSYNARRWIMRHTLSANRPLDLASIEFKEELRLLKFVPMALAGDELAAAPRGRIGIMFVCAQTQEKLQMLYDKALDRELYKIHTN